ncbi:ester cyclase [Variovorax saccharolyticus]|uniref:ester cyclase n=1 Tax=Variovorax saccharolyticus TaxID=3053516 RepID=UPI0025754799|nr:nuclear transport factor 2 family protein [Variovorax sp. J22R187]MDM0021249.1 nuclear transport factor 2 family protein [Variovorax sp. J22R187]
MDSEELAQRYFSAWKLRDAGAVLETFAPGGTYCDPITAGPIAGEAFRSYMEQLWSAFPDLSFEPGRMDSASDGVVCAAWTMLGTNTGSLLGPPANREAGIPAWTRCDSCFPGRDQERGRLFRLSHLAAANGVANYRSAKGMGADNVGQGRHGASQALGRCPDIDRHGD